jgi:UDP-N-acetyl-D-glucosamine dehydrogenase
VLVLGVAYKRDIDDYRESPAINVMDLLEKKGAQVAYYDPHVPSFKEEGHSRTGIADLSDLAGYDVVVITTDHRGIDYGDVVARSRLLVDTRNATKLVSGDKSHVYGL